MHLPRGFAGLVYSGSFFRIVRGGKKNYYELQDWIVYAVVPVSANGRAETVPVDDASAIVLALRNVRNRKGFGDARIEKSHGCNSLGPGRAVGITSCRDYISGPQRRSPCLYESVRQDLPARPGVVNFQSWDCCKYFASNNFEGFGRL